MQKDFLTLEDFSPKDVESLVKETLRLKTDPFGETPLKNKSVALFFRKSSTRTRMAFEVGIRQLGGHSIFLSPDDIQVGRGESISDTARVMSRYIDGLVVRTYEQSEIVELAERSDIPVINALTDKYHPCQAIADYATLLEAKGKLKGLKLAYIGDGNNVANSLVIGGALLGVNVHVATPAGFGLSDEIINKAVTIGQGLIVTDNPQEAAENADAIYTDTWVSMGQEGESASREKAFAGYIVDAKLVKKAKPDASIMHCLPAYRGKEISAEAIDGPQSIVWEQAENKLHAQKAVLKMIIGGKV